MKWIRFKLQNICIDKYVTLSRTKFIRGMPKSIKIIVLTAWNWYIHVRKVRYDAQMYKAHMSDVEDEDQSADLFYIVHIRATYTYHLTSHPFTFYILKKSLPVLKLNVFLLFSPILYVGCRQLFAKIFNEIKCNQQLQF